MASNALATSAVGSFTPSLCFARRFTFLKLLQRFNCIAGAVEDRREDALAPCAEPGKDSAADSDPTPVATLQR